MRPRAIDTSNGLLDLIREVYRLGQEDGHRARSSLGGTASLATSLGRQIARWRVIAAYFARAGTQAWRHPYTQEHLNALRKQMTARKIKAASIDTIRADIRKLKGTTR
jgi:hypothetical protein